MSHACHYCQHQCACDNSREWRHRDQVPSCKGCGGKDCGRDKPPTYDPESDHDADPFPEERR